ERESTRASAFFLIKENLLPAGSWSDATAVISPPVGICARCALDEIIARLNHAHRCATPAEPCTPDGLDHPFRLGVPCLRGRCATRDLDPHLDRTEMLRHGVIVKENRAVLVVYASLKKPSRQLWPTVLAISLAALLAACRPEVKAPAPEIRPVRTVTIEKRDAGVPVALTGTIRAQDEAPLAFRVSGRMIERRINNGDRVRPGQLIARLEPQNEQNALRSARANLSAAQGQLTNASNNLR